ncbi:HU family DNA-binding protein [Bacteroides sp. 224]|uniref:HU family DNA-binding protein n=1 Tax=Bacteroides sp. 224 TaxID=2302936 RepID=UPI0013D45FA0|nr:HU family DNA-binding protein [Bacteroides sp. 224]NDV65043.1 DNA-binding protein [Bacteroides sp. 224]
MSLFYKAYQSTLKSQDGIRKFFPRVIKTGGTVETAELAEEVAERSSLTPGDTQNAINNLIPVMRRHLLNGCAVKLNGLGTFIVVSKSNGKGVDTEEEVSASQITGLRIRFTPSYTRNSIEGTTRAMFGGVEFRKWGDKNAKAETTNPGGSNPGGGNNPGGGDEFIDPSA